MGFIFGSIKYLIRTLLKLAILLGIFTAAILLIPNLPPYTSFTTIDLEPTQPRVGALAPNTALNNAQQLYKGRLLGPEAFQIHDGELYTSVHTGEVLKLSPNGHVTFVTKIGRPCTDHSQEHICGRPLGFEIDSTTNQMYLVDAYHGIWRVHLKTDKKQLLVSPRVEIDGKLPMIINDLALSPTKNGDLYYTVSSTDFLLKDGAYTALVDPSGRLMYYDSSKNTSKVLLDDLFLANGVSVSADNQFVVVAESFRYRLLKYYIAGPKKGRTEVFVAGLPGVPDNIRTLPDGSGVLISLYTAFDDDYPLLMKSLAAAPLARKFLARIQRLVEIPFEFLNAQFPNPVFEDIVYKIGHFKSAASIAPGVSGILQVDWDGKIVASYFNTDGSLKGVSDAIVYGDKLLTGLPNFHDFVGAVPAPPMLKKAFATVKVKDEVKKPVEQIQKPVEQKQKPVEQEQKPVEQKQKPVEQKAAPKVAKPVEAPKPTPAEPVKTTPKPVETPKPVPTTPPPKQTETTTQKPPVTKPVQPEKVEIKKNAYKVGVKKATEKTEPKNTAEKVEPQKTAEPKKTPEKAKPAKKEEPEIIVVRNPKSDKKEDDPEMIIVKEPKKPTKEIPVREDIPADTAKPTKEKLKVIKKTGPSELPVV